MNVPRRVVLGVTGSIAAYKAAELIRLLRKGGIEVHVILTRVGAEFVTPLTFGTLSGNPVTTDMFADSSGGPYLRWGQTEDSSVFDPAPSGGGPAALPEPGIRHIQVSRESGLIVVAPASGNILGKVAAGIADDPLSTAIMASSAPVLFAPAMNTRMWESPAVRANVQLLLERGYHFVQPGSGELACGEVGTGRMAEPREIAGEIFHLLAAGTSRRQVLVTAGRTEEPIDPVRFLSNRSSGRMGFAVAEAARDLGYSVTLIAGLTAEDPPGGVQVVRVRTAEEMSREVLRLHSTREILVMAAAIADYRAADPVPDKIASGQAGLTLGLVPNPDILASLRGLRKGMVTVGFALETSDPLDRARRKLESKGCDFIVVNNPLRAGSEFGSATNEVTFLFADSRAESLPLISKYAVGGEILLRAENLLEQGNGAEDGAESIGPQLRAARAPAAGRAGAGSVSRTGGDPESKGGSKPGQGR